VKEIIRKKPMPLLVLLAITVSLQTAVAQSNPSPDPTPLTPQSLAAPASSELIIIADETNNPPPPIAAPKMDMVPNAIQTATINVNYIDAATTWNTQPTAKAAFQYAVDIWASLINSSVPITIDAYWEDLSYISPNVLGAAGATTIWLNRPGFPYTNTFYPAALANSLVGYDLDPSGAEIRARFNSSFASWYFGTDTSTPFNKYNFATVVLHEIGHGLGFFGSMKVDNGIGDFECRGISGEGCWGVFSNGAAYPIIYDRFTRNGSGTPLINTGIYPNPSIQLGLQLKSNNIFFDGPASKHQNGDVVPLYAPSIWKQGSSYSHLGESFNYTENALMTYSLSNGETNYHPGFVALGMLKDIGWQVYLPAEMTQLPTQLLEVDTQLIDVIDAFEFTVLQPGFPYTLSYAMTDYGAAEAGVGFNGRFVSIDPQPSWIGKTTATVQVLDQSNKPSSSTFTVLVTEEIKRVYLPSIVK
jgi:hypothetical protein